MTRILLALAIVLVFDALPARYALGQQIVQSSFRRPVHDTGGQREATQRTAQPSSWPYIIVGGIAGALVAGSLAYNDLKNSDAILGEVGVAIAAAGGAVVGAGVGWVVHRLRYRQKASSRAG